MRNSSTELAVREQERTDLAQAAGEDEASVDGTGRPTDGAAPETHLEKTLTRLAGDERKRFLVGSVAVPIIVALMIIFLGAYLTSSYQDWQDQRSRVRDLVTATREAATVLSGRLDNLEQRGAALERIWSDRGVLAEIQVVDESLAQVEGLARAISRVDFGNTESFSTGNLLKEVAQCKDAVEAYSTCLGEVLGAGADRILGDDKCTQDFRASSAATGSCDSIMVSAFSLTQ